MAEEKKITIESMTQHTPPMEIITEGYLLIYMKGGSAKMTGELDPKVFAPLILNALAKKFGG